MTKTWIDGKPGIIGRIAVLTKWRKVQNQYEGVVYNHPLHKDGTTIRTSSVIEEDGDVIVTENTTYRLEGVSEQTDIEEFVSDSIV